MFMTENQKGILFRYHLRTNQQNKDKNVTWYGDTEHFDIPIEEDKGKPPTPDGHPTDYSRR